MPPCDKPIVKLKGVRPQRGVVTNVNFNFEENIKTNLRN